MKAFIKELFFGAQYGRVAECAKRWAAEENRARKTKELLDRISRRGIDKMTELNIAAVPMVDPRRVLVVSADEFKAAAELGFDRLYGLELRVASE